jgi:hypothetical protein
MGESTGGGGNESDNEPRGTTFGVDGVSKTGSTSKDQQIGFTDGQGGKGANFDALQGATSQQTTAAVAAADAARDAGASQTAAQAAVSNILESYDPSAVNRQGNLTDSGQGLVSRAVQEAIEDTAEFDRIQRDQQAANIMGIMTDAPPARAPADFDSQLLDFLDVTQPTMSPEAFRAAEVAGVRAPPAMGQDMQLMSLPSPSPARALQTSPYRGTTTQLLGRQMTSDLQSPEERQNILQEVRNRATVGDDVARQVLENQAQADELGLAGAGRVDLNAPNPFAAPSRQALVPVGIQSLPEAATAASVLGTSPSDMMLVGQQNMPANVTQSAIDRAQFPNTLSPDVDSFAVNAPGGGMMSVPVNQTPINQSNLSPMQLLAAQQNIFGDDYQPTAASVLGTSPAGITAIPTAQVPVTTAPDPLLTTGTAPMPTENSVVGGMERVDPTQVGGISVPTPPPDRFKTNAQRDFFENLASLPGGQAQFDAELVNLENRGFTGRRIAKVIGEGGVPNYDPSAPEGFRIRGATGTNFVDLPFLGTTPISTYTGLDNPNAPADTSSDEPVTAKAPTDPCPAGYQLVDGVCQPVDDLIQQPDPSPPGSDFIINPTTGLPTLFTPATQATQVGQINPFVLQPYASPPVGINPPGQGIQGLSPTGAALGRQV